MNRSALVLGFLLAATLVRAQADVPDAEQYKIDVELRRWQPDLDAQIQKSADDAEGTLIDVTEDLGVGNHGTYELRGTLQLGVGHKIRVTWTSLDYDGDTELEREIRFGGTVYETGTRVVTSIKGNYYSGEYEWDIAKGSWGYFGPVFGVKMFDGDTVLVAPELGDRRIVSLHVPIPVIGLASRVYIGRLSGSASLSGLTLGDRGHLYELDLGAHFALLPRLGFGVGYRSLKMRGHNDPDLLEFKLSGIYFGANVRL